MGFGLGGEVVHQANKKEKATGQGGEVGRALKGSSTERH